MPVQAIPPAQVRPRSRLAGPAGEPLRFGYTVSDVDRFTRAALRSDTTTRGIDVDDRYEAAWFGVVEHLYSAEEPPDGSDLLTAALDGLRALRNDDFHTRGRNKRASAWEPLAGRAPGFTRYWSAPRSGATEPAFVTTVTDRLALVQIFAQLTSEHREALLALAVYPDHRQAARALRICETAFCRRLTSARQAFTQLWHEHETAPARMWRKGQRIGRRELPERVTAVLSPAELPGVLLADALDVFARLDADRMYSRDLLPLLAQAKPHIYGQWDLVDLGAAFRACGIPPRDITINGATGRGYHRQRIEHAAEDAHDPRPAGDDCDLILAAWLHQEQKRRRAQQPATRDDMRALIAAAGPAGTRVMELEEALPSVTSKTIYRWLADDLANGLLVRLSRGRYAIGQAA